MMSAREVAEMLGENLTGAGLYLAERILGSQSQKPSARQTEADACREAHLAALPIVMVSIGIGLTGLVVTGLGRQVEKSATLAVEIINIYGELTTANNPGATPPFQPYQGPRSEVLRAALGIVVLPVSVVAQLVA